MSTGQGAETQVASRDRTHCVDYLQLQIDQNARDFYFRAGSSDRRVIDQTFGEKQYVLYQLRRFDELKEFAAETVARGKRPLIVDAGANIGATPLYFSAKFPAAKIVAIEPDAGNHRFLVENTKGLRVVPLRRAVAATRKRVRMVDVGEGFWGYQTRAVDDDEAGGIPTIMINDIYEANADQFIPFIAKIDIEGAEKDLFSENLEWVEKTPLIIIELHDWLSPGQGIGLPFLRCIAALDRDFITIGEDVYSIANNLPSLIVGARGSSGGTVHGKEQDMNALISSSTAPASQSEEPPENGLSDKEIRVGRSLRTELESLEAKLVAALDKERELTASEDRLRTHLSSSLERERGLRTQLDSAQASERALQAQLDSARASERELRAHLSDVEAELRGFRESEIVALALKSGRFLNRRAPWVLQLGKWSVRKIRGVDKEGRMR